MHFPYSITVEVHRAPARQKFGDVTRVFHHKIEGCAPLAPRYSSESTDNSNRVIVGFSLFGPPGADILADDWVKTPDGNTYNVLGEAAEWTNPFTGWKAGFEAALERVK